MKADSQESTPKRVNNLPTLFLRCFSDCCFWECLPPPFFFWLSSLQNQCCAFLSLSQPGLLTVKSPGFGDVVWAGAYAGLLGERPMVLGLMQA